MIDIKYSKAILNLLLGKRSDGEGMSKEAEKQWFLSQGIPMMVSSEEMLSIVILPDDYTNIEREKEKKSQEFLRWKQAINELIFWETAELGQVEKKHTYVDEYGREQTIQVSASGWKVVAKTNVPGQVVYPMGRYLALFTTMPDADGKNFKEPFYNNDSEATTYKRVDLNKSYFAQAPIMCEANHDVENGGAVTNNVYTIYYPEIIDVDWATSANPLVGFGIFENETPQEGEVPYLWGSLSNTGTVTARVDHIPLFRVGEFQLSIS